MSKVTLKALINNSSMSEKLVRATVRQFGGIDGVNRVCQDVSNHGIDAGFSGFISTNDTVKFAEKNKTEIMHAFQNQALELGYKDALDFVLDFKCLQSFDLNGYDLSIAIHEKKHKDHAEVMNTLAWFAAEELARTASDLMED